MKHRYCAGSVTKRCASRLWHLTAELSTTQVRKNLTSRSDTETLASDRGDCPSHGSLPQSRANEYCASRKTQEPLVGGVGPGSILPPGVLGASAIVSSSLRECGPGSID